MSAVWAARLRQTYCRTIAGMSLLVLYADAILRIIQGFFGDGFGPLLSSSKPCFTHAHDVADSPSPGVPRARPFRLDPEPNVAFSSRMRPSLKSSELERLDSIHAHDSAEHNLQIDNDTLACMKHEMLLGSLYADLAPWVDQKLKITEREMERIIQFVAEHRGKWDSWVTDTLTPILIKGGNVYLTLGPPTKDPTNYFVS